MEPIRPEGVCLVMSDVDESFIYGCASTEDPAEVIYNTDGLLATIRAINEARKSRPVQVWWNTVRVLETIQALVKHPQLGPVLETLVLDGLIVNNGKQLYANQSGRNCLEWVPGLNENRDQSHAWQRYIEGTLNWDQALLDKTFRQILNEAGFEKSGEINPDTPLDTEFILPRGDLRPVYEIWINLQKPGYVVYYSPKHNTVRLAVWDKRLHWKEDTLYATRLKDALEKALLAKSVKFEPAIVQEKPSHDGRFALNIVRFNPKGVNKGRSSQAALDDLKGRCAISKIIVVGDDRPDAALLNGQYRQNGTPVEKTAIICHLPGRNEAQSPLWELQQKADYPYVTAESGALGQALRQLL